MIISLIVALTEEGVMGRDNQLPWHIPSDLKRFKEITQGHPIIMGRKTYDSIGRPLPKRRNIVISRQQDLKIEGVEVLHSLDAALALFKDTDQEVFVIGGAQIFEDALPIADRLYLTWVHEKVSGDVYFPMAKMSNFKKIFEEHHKEPMPFTFADYVREHSA